MDIHVVQEGETLNSIADRYGVLVERLIVENGIDFPYILVRGQALVITYPEEVYVVQEGDTLESISQTQGVSVLQIIRNNPHLSDRGNLIPGETLVTTYLNNKGAIITNGYAFTHISRDALGKTLPFLTYLTIFGHRITEGGRIIGIDDEEIIMLAKEYGVSPLMHLSTITVQGEGSLEVVYSILYNEELTNQLISDVITLLLSKGYAGLNITYLFITEDNYPLYESFTVKLYNRLKANGLYLYITIPRRSIIDENELSPIDFTVLGQYSDSIVVMNYYWGYAYGPPEPIASIREITLALNYLITQVPPEEIKIGLPLLGYNWQMPYIVGVSRSNFLTIKSVISLARQVNATILFDEISQTPYFNYIDETTGVPIENEVWFIDARSIVALLNLIDTNNLRGAGMWSIMEYNPQLWLLISSQYEIVNLVYDT